MNEEVNVTPKRLPLTYLAGGILLVLYLGLCIFTVFFYRIQSRAGDSPSPTLTATVVSTPQIVVHRPDEKQLVKYEDFSSNVHEWGLHFSPYGKLEVTNGKLILQSYIREEPVIGTSYGSFAPWTDKYCIQAHFATDAESASSFGLVFGLDHSVGTFYLFEVWPRSKEVRLMAYNTGKLHERVPFTKVKLSPYPEATMLSVCVGKKSIELYTNGELAANYSGPYHFQSRDIGFFVSDAGYRLIVANLFIYPEE